MAYSSDDIAAQTAAFLASGGKVEQVEAVKDPKLASAHYYNAAGKIAKGRYQRRGRRVTPSKMKLMMS